MRGRRRAPWSRNPRVAPIGLIGIAFDGSPEAHAALRTAHDLAARTGAALRALMVIEPPAAIPGQFVPLPGLEPLVAIERADALQRREQAATSALDAAVHALGDGVAVAVEQQVLFGSDPAATILEIAGADVDLLVLGSRAYGPMRRALVGSVSSAIVRHAPRPVLVTPRVGDGAG